MFALATTTRCFELDKRQRGPQGILRAALEIPAVADDDAVEIPREHLIERGAQGGAILDGRAQEPRDGEAIVAAVDPKQHAAQERHLGTEIKDEISQDQRAARAMKEDDFVESRHAA